MYNSLQLQLHVKHVLVIDWLSDCDIPVSDEMCMPILNSLIKLRKPRFKTFKICSPLAEHGHFVLRLLPYYPDLNLIELTLGSVNLSLPYAVHSTPAVSITRRHTMYIARGLQR
jgi:hypothetical protein